MQPGSECFCYYRMRAADGKAAGLADALQALAAIVRAAPGCVEVRVLRDIDQEDSFAFIEQWASREAYLGASGHLPKDAFAQVKANLKEPPQRALLGPT